MSAVYGPHSWFWHKAKKQFLIKFGGFFYNKKQDSDNFIQKWTKTIKGACTIYGHISETHTSTPRPQPNHTSTPKNLAAVVNNGRGTIPLTTDSTTGSWLFTNNTFSGQADFFCQGIHPMYLADSSSYCVGEYIVRESTCQGNRTPSHPPKKIYFIRW